ncbi:MAG TPA: CapA family protein [Mobilitalea sp.]|nr:CapA family protein [Mobilitalea sp.]
MKRIFPKETYKRLLGIIVILLVFITLSGCSKTKEPVVVNAPMPTESVVQADSQKPTELPDSTAATPTPAITEAFVNDSHPSQPSVTVTPTQAPVSTVKLLAVGDNLIHIQVIDSGRQADGTYNYDNLYSNIKADISAADIAVINQETILGGNEKPYSGYPNFNSPDEIGTAVINAGFDVVLHATNHSMDMGTKGIEHTLWFWSQHPQIKVLGINQSKEAQEQIPIIEKNGIKIAMLNYTYGLNGYTLPKDKPYLVNLFDKEKMKADIQKAEELADFTIVFPHWGSEYTYNIDSVQEELTKFFYENGVDLVIGSHPHVLEPVKWIETEKNHRMLVYYSLGNFMSYQKEAPRMLGGIANVTITKDGTGTYISDASITPIITHYENGPDDYNYAIYKLSDYNEELARVHGVSEIARNGPLTYQNTLNLAKEILGSWYQ